MRKKEELTQQRLKELLSYDPETGVFTWIGSGSGRARKEAGWVDQKGYLCIGVCGKVYKAHRLAWYYVTGTWPADQIDHVDRSKLNNRISNLRQADTSLNKQNVGDARSDNVSRVLGVSQRGSRFQSRVWSDGKSVHVGTFGSAKEAHEAYLAVKRQVHQGCTI